MAETSATLAPSDVEVNRLREHLAEITQLAGSLAHEIRNPLSVMRLNLDLLAEDFRESDDARDRRVVDKIERVRKESQRLEDLLADFLRYARVQAIETEPTDLNAVVDSLCDFFEAQLSAGNHLLRRHFDNSLPPVAIDSNLLKQALFNLIRNAQLAMPDGGELILQTRRDGPWAIIDVIDTGCGIPRDLQTRVFEGFFSTRKHGTGLGLPTVRRIVEAHGGSLALESEPGKGTKFIVRLPIDIP